MRLFRPCFFSGWLYPGALFRLKTSEKVLCLTFDDGPDPGSTPELLNILINYNIKAFFFCDGKAAEKYPELVRKIIINGHSIGNHGYNHLNGWKTSTGKYCNDIYCASQFTSDNLLRLPYGRIRFNQFRQLRKQFRIIFWDVMPYDFDKSFSSEKSLAVLNKKIRPGSIIVLHDTQYSTWKYFLKDFIEISISKGYKFAEVI
jgi:peptidoglycan/xylan/chitin deacetylase (PgdA/CDA1 family)